MKYIYLGNYSALNFKYSLNYKITNSQYSLYITTFFICSLSFSLYNPIQLYLSSLQLMHIYPQFLLPK